MTRSKVRDLDLTSVATTQEFRTLQQVDQSLTAFFELMEQAPFPNNTSYYFLLDCMLMHYAKPQKGLREAKQMVVPESLRTKLLFSGHDVPVAGHLGVA